MLTPFTTKVKTNIDGVLQMTQMINGIMMTGDSRANQILVELYSNEGRIRIADGTKIVGYFIRGDGYTVEIDGSVTENGEAKVVIPRSAYLITGALSIAIRLFDDKHTEIIDGTEIITWGTKIVIAALSCFVQNTETDAIIDPDHHIPDVQELLAYIERLDEIKDEMLADNALMNENETVRQANELARISETEATLNKINNMTTDARRKNYDEDPTAEISDVDGHKHIRFGLPVGDPFKIKKTFASIAEMEAYTGTDVEYGDFVLIVSNVQDPDNAKLYLKDTSSWRFIVDLSGSQGFKGETGNGIDNAVLNDDYTLTLNYTDGTSTTTSSIRGAQGEQGIQGIQGVGIQSTTLNPDDYTLTIVLTDGTSYTTPSIRGEVGYSIINTTLNPDYTLTITYSDGATYTTPSIRGEQGIRGITGNGIESASMTDDYKLQLTFTDGNTYTTPRSIRGEKGLPGTGTIDCQYDPETDYISVTIGI